MALLAASSTGNLSAAIWSVADSVSFQTYVGQNSVSTVSGSTGTPVQSASFAPGAITVDGIGLYVTNVSAGVGSITVRLFNVAANAVVASSSVTIAVNDLPGSPQAAHGWIFFKFSVPLTLLSATNYAVQVIGAVSGGSITFQTTSTAGNFCRYLRTTTTQSPAAADALVIVGERTGAGVNSTFTITIDTTVSTAYASLDIGQGCTLISGVAVSTAYILKVSGVFWCRQGAILTLGTSGTPIPSTSSILIDVSTGASNAIWIDNDCTVETHGATKTGLSYFAADYAIGSTTITVTDATGWKIGDTLVLSSSTVNWSDYETKTITSVSGTTIGMSATTKTHTATSPFVCEVLNITRNVVFKGNTSSCGFRVHNFTISDFSYTEWNIFGGSSSTGDGRHGIELWNAQSSAYHNNLTGCAIHDCFGTTGALQIGQSSLDGNSAVNINVQSTVLYNMTNGITSQRVVSSGLTLNNVALILTGTGNNGIAFQNLDFVMTNMTISSAQAVAFFFIQNNATVITGTYNNLTAHSCGSFGFHIATNVKTLSTVTIWRTAGLNLTSGYIGSTASFITLDTWNFYSNATAQITLQNTINYPILFKNCIINGGSSSTSGLLLASTTGRLFTFESCTFSGHTGGDINITALNTSFVTLNNTTLGSSTPVHNPTNLTANGFIIDMLAGGVAGAHSAYVANGVFLNDTAIKHAGTSSLRMTPNGKGTLTSLFNIKVAVFAGDVPTVSVWVRKSIIADGGSAYAGAAPRLVILFDPTNNYANETVLATSVAANGTWELLTAILSAIPENTILTLAVDTGASAGFCNFDDFTINIPSRDTSNLNFFDAGQATALLGNTSPPLVILDRRTKVT